MIQKMLETMEYDKILDMLAEHALSEKAANRIKRLEPYLSEIEVERHMKETTEARLIAEHTGNPPLSAMNEIEKSLDLLKKDALLMPDNLSGIAQFLTSCRRLKAYLKKAESTFTTVASYGNSLYDLSEVEEEIIRAVRGSELDDRASPQLYDIRRKIETAGSQMKAKLDSLLRNNKVWFSEGFVSFRNGHYTLPVKREYKNQVNGTVIDISQSGSTYFIEPAAAKKLQEELSLLHIEEDNEVRRILYMLTALVHDNLPSISRNIEVMEVLDFIFAKAKLSMAMKASPIPVTTERKIEIRGGRHPLLKSDTVVPLDFSIGGTVRGVIITGPNTGGKTVALKTAGLLSLMAQSGLHVPAESGCFAMNNYVLCDIGDRQSITENLSTFSSHLTNIIEILKTADDQSLVLLDELGSGTDPAEGMGLAIAILEELSQKGCLFVATTHYPEIKEFAKNTPGLVNARMAFDRQSLQPLYRLEIGEAGESCALYIAKRLGLPQRIIDRAGAAAYGKALPGQNHLNPVRHRTWEPDGRTGENAEIPDKRVTDVPRRLKVPEEVRKPVQPGGLKFNIGDSVMVYPQKKIGIVYLRANEKGEVGVQIKENKQLINHKRLKLHVPASELYPDNYDFSIVFDPVDIRKKRKAMTKRHDSGLVIEIPEKERG